MRNKLIKIIMQLQFLSSNNKSNDSANSVDIVLWKIEPRIEYIIIKAHKY